MISCQPICSNCNKTENIKILLMFITVNLKIHSLQFYILFSFTYFYLGSVKDLCKGCNLQFTSAASSCSTQEILKIRLYLLKWNAVLPFHCTVKHTHMKEKHHNLYISESVHSSPKVFLKLSPSK
jgi:hypothetical protein